jgi:actin-related protein
MIRAWLAWAAWQTIWRYCWQCDKRQLRWHDHPCLVLDVAALPPSWQTRIAQSVAEAGSEHPAADQ